MSDNVDQKPITDEKELEQKDTQRFEELKKVPETERTEEQKNELGELKERYGKRMQKKIDRMNYENKTLQEQLEQERKEKEELLKRLPEKKDDASPAGAEDETVEIGGKKYFTDSALIAQVKSGKITEEKAYAYQRNRDKEDAIAEFERRQEEKTRRNEDLKLRKEDADLVKKTYPHFDKSNPEFNPKDPLYKLANELYQEGYAANPKGLSLAIKRAKEILRISDENIDRSEDFGVEGSQPPERKKNEKEITLSDDEKEAAIRQFTRGDVTNPKTNRPYTDNEALAKALQAKKSRLTSRRI